MLSLKIKDITFKSPIIAASGTFVYGDEVKDFVDLGKIGAIVTKSITLEPRKGNPVPRIHEVELKRCFGASSLAACNADLFLRFQMSIWSSIEIQIIERKKKPKQKQIIEIQ